MSTRIIWNEHEQAVLFQALIDVLNGKIERKINFDFNNTLS